MSKRCPELFPHTLKTSGVCDFCRWDQVYSRALRNTGKPKSILVIDYANIESVPLRRRISFFFSNLISSAGQWFKI